MEFEVLHRSKKKKFIIAGCFLVVILVAIVLGITFAKYRVARSIPLASGTINYSLADLNIVAITVDGEASDTIPEGNYELASTSYCTYKDGSTIEGLTLKYDSNTKAFSITPYTTKGTKCYLDFVTATTKKVDTILGTIEVNLDTPNFANTSCTSGCREATVGIYETTDNLGTAYYYRGDVENNYVSFAGYYWRIIRINGDGSIRIIYDGTSAHANGESSSDRQTGTSAFNILWNYSYGVGYTYTTAQRPSSQNEGTTSNIKYVLDSWYQTNIAGKGLDSKVVSAPGFCNDREVASGYSWRARPSRGFYYAAYERLYTNKTPILYCSNNLDLYTTKIGLITADEVAMAGGVYGSSNISYYLYTGQTYWTMTPETVSAGGGTVGANVSLIWSSGRFGMSDERVYNTYGVRPVLNLSVDITLTGSGTMTDPYVVN